MDFIGAISAAFRKYATFTGTATRSEYWYWYLFTALGSLITITLDSAFEYGVFNGIFGLVTLLPGLAVLVRRLRDAGYSWTWVLASIPGVVTFTIGIVILTSAALSNLVNTGALDSDMITEAQITAQIESVLGDPAFVPAFTSAILLVGLGFLLILAYLILMLIFLVQPSKSFEQGNKYLKPKNPEITGETGL